MIKLKIGRDIKRISMEENYMFFQNLQTIKSAVDSMLQMDPSEVDKMLSQGHGWAVDHIATSKDDVEEVAGFLTNSTTKGFVSGIDTSMYNVGDTYNSQPQFVPVTLDTKDKMKKFIKEIIRKVGSHYELKSHTGKTLGKGTKSEMETRERQVNYFKHKG
jgi:hypothetical protein